MGLFHLVWIIALAVGVKFVFDSTTRPHAAPAAAIERSEPRAQTVSVGDPPPQALAADLRPGEGAPVGPPRPREEVLSFEQQCEKNLPPTRVDVELAPPQVAYDFSHGIDTLTQGMQRGENGVILGLTKNGLGAQFQWRMNIMTQPLSGKSCMRPHIHITVAQGAQHVYVAREFQQGGCAFNEVLQHENTHVTANRDQLALSALELRGTLKRTLGNRVFYGDQKELEGQLTDAVNQYWMPLAKLKFSAASPVHAEIDSEAGYRDVLSRCNGEFANVLRALRR